MFDSVRRTGADPTAAGAAVRTVVAFIVFFATLVAAGMALAQVPTPDVLTILPTHVATLCGVAAVVFVSPRAFDVSPATYGLDVDRRWLRDLFGGVLIGGLFQAVVTAAILGTGTGRIVDRWATGVADGVATTVIAVGATVVAFFIVALWEDLLFSPQAAGEPGLRS